MGLPTWAWGGGIVGAIAVGLYLRSRNATATTAPTAATGTDTTGTDTTGATGSGISSTDLSGIEQQLSDLQTELSNSPGLNYDPNATYEPWGPGVDNPGGGVLAIPSTGTPFTTSPGKTVTSLRAFEKAPTKTGRAKRTAKPKVNKAKGRTPARKPPKPTPKPVKQAHKKAAKPKAKRTAAAHNIGTFRSIAKVSEGSQAVHRSASRAPSFTEVIRRRGR